MSVPIRSWLVFLLAANLSSAFAAQSFHLREEKIQAPEMGEITCYILTSGSQEFSFMPPRAWTVGLEANKQRITFQSTDNASSITLAFGSSETAGEEEPDVEVLRRQVLAQFSQGRVIEEFPCFTSSHKGRGFQVQWIAGGQVPMLSRVAYFWTPTGPLQFTLTTMSDRFKAVQPVLGSLMTSFQLKGKVQPQTPKSAKVAAGKPSSSATR